MNTALRFPPGFDRNALFSRLNSAALEHSSEYRKAITRTSPLLFACCYLLHHLSSDDTGGQTSFSQFHIDMAHAAQRWMRPNLAPAEMRDAWIAPREAAKSTWTLLINPLWALAHDHRRYIQAFSATADQARVHLATLREELRANALLRYDYPELCTPKTDHAELYVARSGVAMAARGIDASSLGAKIGSQRPSVLLIDDIEPEASNYDAGLKEKRLATIVNAVFPMSINAVVQWTGTTTTYGSLMHDLVKAATSHDAAPWITEQNIKVHYYRPIVTDDDGTERSMWPQRWSLEYLQSIRHTRTYALNFLNQPPSTGGAYWNPEDIPHGPVPGITERVLWVDGAVTHGTTSDYTGMAVVGYSPSVRKTLVEYAQGFKLTPAGVRGKVSALLHANPSIRLVLVEANQGGEMWRDVLSPMPSGVRVELVHSSESKPVRFQRVLSYYQDGWVSHVRELPALEEQQLGYPNVAHDDVLDAVCGGVHHFLAGQVRVGVRVA